MRHLGNNIIPTTDMRSIDGLKTVGANNHVEDFKAQAKLLRRHSAQVNPVGIHPDLRETPRSHRTPETTSRRRRAAGGLALAGVMLAGGALGLAKMAGGDVAPSHPAGLSAKELKNMFGPVDAAGTKLGAHAEKAEKAEKLKSMNVENDSDVPGVTLTATDGGYSLGGFSETPVTQSSQLDGFGDMTNQTLKRLEEGQNQYGLTVG